MLIAPRPEFGVEPEAVTSAARGPARIAGVVPEASDGVVPQAVPEPVVEVAAEVIGLHAVLAAQGPLTPSPMVDRLFTRLVRICCTTAQDTAAAVLSDARILALADGIRRLCADGEAALEQFWAARALAAANASTELSAFPYLDNYRHLVRLEVHALAGVGVRLGPQTRVCLVGGGPLPLTALELHRRTGARVTVVDRDPDAVRAAAELLARLSDEDGSLGGHAGAVGVVRADARTGEGLAAAVAGCDVVVLAALVGLDRQAKADVLGRLASVLGSGAHVVVRTADGLRTLLYPQVDVADVRSAGFVPEVLLHPLGEVINSILVARRR